MRPKKFLIFVPIFPRGYIFQQRENHLRMVVLDHFLKLKVKWCLGRALLVHTVNCWKSAVLLLTTTEPNQPNCSQIGSRWWLIKIIHISFNKQLHFRVEPRVSIKIPEIRLKVAKYFWNRGSTLLSCLTILGSNVKSEAQGSKMEFLMKKMSKGYEKF